MGEPLAAVSKYRTKADRFGNIVPYADGFNEELVWATFVQACRDLGPACVDWSRLSVLGYSMGGQSTWHLMLRYGSQMAAAVPFAGCCTWEDFDWNLDEATAAKELGNLAIRAYHGETDTGTYSWRDFWWLAQKRGLQWEPSERKESHVENVDV